MIITKILLYSMIISATTLCIERTYELVQPQPTTTKVSLLFTEQAGSENIPVDVSGSMGFTFDGKPTITAGSTTNVQIPRYRTYLLDCDPIQAAKFACEKTDVDLLKHSIAVALQNGMTDFTEIEIELMHQIEKHHEAYTSVKNELLSQLECCHKEIVNTSVSKLWSTWITVTGLTAANVLTGLIKHNSSIIAANRTRLIIAAAGSGLIGLAAFYKMSATFLAPEIRKAEILETLQSLELSYQQKNEALNKCAEVLASYIRTRCLSIQN